MRLSFIMFISRSREKKNKINAYSIPLALFGDRQSKLKYGPSRKEKKRKINKRIGRWEFLRKIFHDQGSVRIDKLHTLVSVVSAFYVSV